MITLQVVETTLVREGGYYVHRGRLAHRVEVCYLAVDDRTGTEQVVYRILEGPEFGAVRSASLQRFATLYKSPEYCLTD